MAATVVDGSKGSSAAAAGAPPAAPVDALADSLANVDIQDRSDKKPEHPPRELHVYTHAQLLWISESPLVKPPDGMPALKDWFGYALIC